MAAHEKPDEAPIGQQGESEPAAPTPTPPKTNVPRWKQLLGFSKTESVLPSSSTKSSIDAYEEMKAKPEKWSMGVLNDRETEEVPGESSVQQTTAYYTGAQSYQGIRCGQLVYVWAGNRLTPWLPRFHSSHVQYHSQ